MEDIIYQTTRNLRSMEDKLLISTIFLFCYKLDDKKFAKLLYTKDLKGFILKLESQYKDKYGANFLKIATNKEVRRCFNDTLIKVKEKYDKNRYYEALFNGDPYAIAISGIATLEQRFPEEVLKRTLLNK